MRYTLRTAAAILLVLILHIDSATGIQIGPRIRVKRVPKWLGDTAKVVINPTAALPTVIKPASSEVAKIMRIDPDAANRVVTVAFDPAPTTAEVGLATIKVSISTTIDQVKASRDFAKAVALGKLSKMGEALAEFQNAQFNMDLNPAVTYTLQMATSLIPMFDRESYMEKPQVLSILPSTTTTLKSGVVVYVNGMAESTATAKGEAQLLANRLERRVDLLYNNSRGVEADSLEAVYDRAWIITQAAGLPLVGKTVAQANRTTRQLTYILFHADTPVSLVTYSQGCLIGRNALMAASRMRGDGYPEKLVSWVALGVPLRDDEILVKPKKYHGYTNKNDSVGAAIGLRLFGGGDKKNLVSGHAFNGYVEYVEERDLF